MQINRDAVATEGVVSLPAVGGTGKRSEMTRMTAVIEDHLLVQLAERIVHCRSAQNCSRLAERGHEGLHLRMRIVERK